MAVSPRDNRALVSAVLLLFRRRAWIVMMPNEERVRVVRSLLPATSTRVIDRVQTALDDLKSSDTRRGTPSPR